MSENTFRLIKYAEVVDGRISNIATTSSSIEEAEGNLEGRTFIENFDLTGGASIGTPVTQVDENGRRYSPEELVEKGILVVKKNQSITTLPDVPEYVVVSDYTKTPFYLRDSGVEIRLPLGEVPDKTKVTTVPPTAFGSTFNGKVWSLSPEVLERRIRQKRNFLLIRTDNLLIPDYPTQDLEAVKLYRQQLRDITKQTTFPTSVTFPDPPEEIAEGILSDMEAIDNMNAGNPNTVSALKEEEVKESQN